MFELLSAELLAQSPADLEYWDGAAPSQQLPPWLLFRIWLASGPLWFVYFGLLVWMIIYCARHDPDRSFWIWIMLIVQPFGALVYFVVRYIPSSNFDDFGIGKWWKRRQRLPQLRSAAQSIGNAHQFIQLGDLLWDLRRPAAALDAYRGALAKEPGNLAALWGAASAEMKLKEYSAAREKLAAILEKDFGYKFGDVSVLYAKALLAVQEPAAAREHLSRHVKRWRQPEALFLLGKLCLENQEPQLARQYLEGLIADLELSPPAIARKSLFWKSRARRLLRRLPA
jgi:hypothetical protein